MRPPLDLIALVALAALVACPAPAAGVRPLLPGGAVRRLQAGSPAEQAARRARAVLGFAAAELRGAEAPGAVETEAEAAGLTGNVELSRDEAVRMLKLADNGDDTDSERLGVEVFDGRRTFVLRPTPRSDEIVAASTASGAGAPAATAPAPALAETRAAAAPRAAKIQSQKHLQQEEDVRKAPARMSGYLSMSLNSHLGGGHCTGTLVGRRSVLTASHCFADRKTSKVAKPHDLFFVPAVFSDVGFPFGSYRGKTVAFPPEYFTGKSASARIDLGVVCLDRDVPAEVGFMPYRQHVFKSAAEATGTRLHMYSYPGAPYTGWRQFHDQCPALFLDKTTRTVGAHSCSSGRIKGSSGSAVMVDGSGPGGREVIGVHYATYSEVLHVYTVLSKSRYNWVRNAVAVCEAGRGA